VPYDLFAPLPYISEDELDTFDGWLKYQGFDLVAMNDEQRVAIRDMFDEAAKRRAGARRMGRMKFEAGEHRFAVAIRDGENLWLTLWIRCSSQGDVYIFQPRGDGAWNPHTSLHRNGRLHVKSHDRKVLPPKKVQPPATMVGAQTLGAFGGHVPKTVGAVCDPRDFAGVLEVPAGILGPRNGQVVVDLLSGPDVEPLTWPGNEACRHLFTEVVPHILIRAIAS